jgi:uncharacterized phage protein gp47/JayE
MTTQYTTKQIADNIVAQLEAAFSQTIPLLPKNFNAVLAKVLAALFVTLYKYGGFIFLQLFVRYASAAETTVNGRIFSPLVEWGRLTGAGDPVAAIPAELTADVIVTLQVGSLPSGSQLVGARNGVTYITTGGVLLNAPVVSVTVLAVSDQAGGDGAGVIGNLDPGDVLTFANPLENVARDAAVTAQTVTGADGEGMDEYRQRIVDRFQRRPQGGAYADYSAWGEPVPGVLNVYPYTSTCPGQVDVYVESSTDPDGIASPAQLAAVLAAIELDSGGLATRRPATALVNTFSIVRLVFSVEVSGLVVGDVPTVEAQINAAVSEYFLSRAPYIVGLSVPPRADRIVASSISAIVDAVVSAAGGTFSGVVLKLGLISIPIYTLGVGEKAKGAAVFV